SKLENEMKFVLMLEKHFQTFFIDINAVMKETNVLKRYFQIFSIDINMISKMSNIVILNSNSEDLNYNKNMIEMMNEENDSNDFAKNSDNNDVNIDLKNLTSEKKKQIYKRLFQILFNMLLINMKK